MTDDLDRMLSGGAKSAFNKDSRIGDSIAGIIDNIVVRQATEYQTGKPLTFADSSPREQILVTIRAEGIVPEDEDDDLMRTVYIKGWGQQRRAFQEAAKRDGKPEAGDRFTATFVKEGVNSKGGFPPKEFEYRIVKLEQAANEHWATTGPIDVQRQKLRELGMTEAQIDAALGASDDTPF